MCLPGMNVVHALEEDVDILSHVNFKFLRERKARKLQHCVITSNANHILVSCLGQSGKHKRYKNGTLLCIILDIARFQRFGTNDERHQDSK